MKPGRPKKPRRLGKALHQFLESKSPRTPQAAAEAAWPAVVGEAVAAVTEVVSEGEGVLTIRCESSVWAQELEMMSPRLVGLLAAEIGDEAPTSLRFLT